MARIKKTYSRPKNNPPTKRRRDQAIKAKNKPKKRKTMMPMPLPSPFDPGDFKRPPIMTPYKPKTKGLKGLLGAVGNKAKKAVKKVKRKTNG
jgi:hypothetical protein